MILPKSGNGKQQRCSLWATHEAVNRGAKTFGDWLLTLRGGLNHNLATAMVKDKKSERDPSQQEIKNRRILLALSWLSVEDEHGAQDHAEYIVARGEGCREQPDNQDSRDRKVLAALGDILVARGVPNLTMMLKVKMNPPNDKLPLSLQRKEPDKKPDILLVICSDKVNHSANQLVYSITVIIGINTCSLCLMVRAYHWSQKQKRRHARTLKTIHTRTPNSSERCSRSRHRAWRKPLPNCASRSRNAKRHGRNR